MSGKTIICAFVALAALAIFSLPAAADTVEVPYVEFAAAGSANGILAEHNPDLDPWKGFFQLVIVKNISTESWGGFEFQLIQQLPGFAASEVYFSDAMPSITSQSGASYTVNNDALGGPKMSFDFGSTPVAPNQTVSFSVYTDNTRNKQPFGVYYYPTAVPEPATMALLLGGLLVGMKRRRRA